MSGSTVTKLSKNMPVSPKVLEKIAKVLECEPEDLYEIKDDDQNVKHIKQTPV